MGLMHFGQISIGHYCKQRKGGRSSGNGGEATVLLFPYKMNITGQSGSENKDRMLYTLEKRLYFAV